MKGAVRFAAIILMMLPTLFANSSCSEAQVKLHILEAGSLIIPFEEVEKEFEELHPNIDVLMEGHGSIQVIRHITEIHDEVDLAAVADCSLIPMLMYPVQLPDNQGTYANWTISFATNHLGLAYTPQSQYADEINANNWFDILSRDNVTVGFSDPRFDACGYRAFMLIKLAEDHYRNPSIFEELVANNFQSKIKVIEEDSTSVIRIPELLESTKKRIILRGFSVQLLALLESHDLDYAFQYKSVAQQHGLEFLELPHQIDLSSNEFSTDYQKVKVELDYRRFLSVTPEFQGQLIVYGITIPANAPHPEEAIEFLEFLLGPDGQRILEDCSQPVILPIADNVNNLPAELRALIEQ